MCENEDTHAVTGHDFQAEYDEARQYLQLVLETNASYRQDTQFDKYVQDSERSTSFFFRPPTSHLRRTPIESVTLQDGTESSDANVISLEFGAHWGRIMGEGDDTTPTPSMVQAQDQLLQSISRTLTTDQQASLDAPLTEAEIEMAIKSMSGHRAPSPDGFTAVLYSTRLHQHRLQGFYSRCFSTNSVADNCFPNSASHVSCYCTRRVRGPYRGTTVQSHLSKSMCRFCHEY